MASVDLSSNDAQVLTHLFDPESSSTATISPTLPHPTIPSSLLPTLKSTELRAIQLAESNDLPSALSILTTLTTTHPSYASAYNNLAQVLRLLSAPPLEIHTALSTAISLSAPESPTEPVSADAARVLSQAYTQRGALLYGLFAKMKDGDEALGMAKEEVEMAASRDFFEGGRYGSAVGREMAVRTNPYARLCGAIVKEALTREYVGEECK